MHPTHKPAAVADVEVTPAVILRGAARYLQLHGWCQGATYADTTSPTPPACAMGAIGMAAYGQRFPGDASQRAEWRDYNRTEDFFRDYLNLTDTDTDIDLDPVGDEPGPVGIAGWTLGGWNDQPGRTAEQVITALNGAADEWDRTHGGEPR